MEHLKILLSYVTWNCSYWFVFIENRKELPSPPRHCHLFVSPPPRLQAHLWANKQKKYSGYKPFSWIIAFCEGQRSANVDFSEISWDGESRILRSWDTDLFTPQQGRKRMTSSPNHMHHCALEFVFSFSRIWMDIKWQSKWFGQLARNTMRKFAINNHLWLFAIWTHVLYNATKFSSDRLFYV